MLLQVSQIPRGAAALHLMWPTAEMPSSLCSKKALNHHQQQIPEAIPKT
jgi:hypothetical protein